MHRNINIGTILIILLLSITAGVIGFSVCTESVSAQNFESAFSVCETPSEWREAALGLVMSTVVQTTAVFISSFTMFTLPVCSAVIFYRWISLCYVITALDVFSSVKFMIPTILSYTAVTLLLSYLSYKSICFAKGVREDRINFKRLISSAARHTYTFMTVCGACILLKIIPQILFLNR